MYIDMVGRDILTQRELPVGGADLAKLIERYRDRLSFLHLKDMVDMAGEPKSKYPFQFVELGRGRVDFPAIFAALERIRFQGWAVTNSQTIGCHQQGFFRSTWHPGVNVNAVCVAQADWPSPGKGPTILLTAVSAHQFARHLLILPESKRTGA